MPNPKPSPALHINSLLAAAVVVGFILSAIGVVAPASAAQTESEVAVKWTGDTSSVAGFQPSRDSSSPHFNEFKNLSITVSQTKGLIDQAVRVTVSGFAGTISSPEFGSNAMNYMQAMQCWGDDPSAPNFRKTCQWGGRSGDNSGLGTSVYSDNALRQSLVDVDALHPTAFDNPFLTYDGLQITGKNTIVDPDGAGPLGPQVKIPLRDILDPATTNEVTSARINADGNGFFDFETQSSDQAPQLGCGLEGHDRCWLVVVPRGTIFGGDGAQCSSILDPTNDYLPYTKGRPNSYQGGSPINPKCDYWDNRIVIPLDFVRTGSQCEVGSSEVRVIGSQLMVAAMSSWQPELCRNLKTTYSFATNPDAIARAQTLEGLASVAFSGLPISAGELTTEQERQALADSTMAYAPVGISGVVVAFNAEFSGGRQENMVLSPLIMAKLLTQSYRFAVPTNSQDPAKNVAHLAARNQQIRFLYQDPEFQALNPTNYQKFLLNPAVVLPGPSGADAVRQLWRWIQADPEAVAFLNGEVDPISGMSINPYYLPKGHPNAHVPTFDENGEYVLDANGAAVVREVGLVKLDGSPESLATATFDTFPKDDESKVPLKLTGQRTRFDSLQFSPYTDTLLSGARQAFRANPNSKTVWDPARVNAAGEVGDWVSGGVQQPGQRFVITIADSPSAIRYGLSVASLVLPNSDVVSTPSTAGYDAALAALTPTSLETVEQIDPALVPAGGYPLTMVTYAIVNLTESTAASRASVAAMLEQVTTTGQVSGSSLGQLPDGYLPITAEFAAQSVAAITAIKNYSPQKPTPKPSTSPSTYRPNETYEAGDGGGTNGSADPTVTGGVDALSDDRTPASASSPLLSSTLVIALVVALSGLLLAPMVLRGGRSR